MQARFFLSLLLINAGCAITKTSAPQVVSLDLDVNPSADPPGQTGAFKIAYYVYSKIPSYAHIDQRAPMRKVAHMLNNIPGVTEVEALVPRLVTGTRERVDEYHSGFPSNKTPEPKLKDLQRQANILGANALVVLSHGYKLVYEPNALTLLNGVFFPFYLVLPHYDLWVESYLEGYLIEPATGDVLGHLSSTQSNADEYLTIYTRKGVDRLVEHLDALVEKTGTKLADTLLKASRGTLSAREP